MKGWLPLAVLFLLASAGRLPAEGSRALKDTGEKARQAVKDHETASKRRHHRLERIKKDLRYISEVLDREIVRPGKKDLDSLSKGGLARIAELRRSGHIHPALDPVLDRLETLYRSLPGRTFAAQYPRSLAKAVAHELRWIAENSRSEAELLRLLGAHLVLPNAADQKGFLKVDVPIDEFTRQGPIKVFIAKHRMKRPQKHVRTTAAAVVGGKHNVQIGVEVEGTVTSHKLTWIDGDYTFDFGLLHIELTPEWRAAHPRIPRPRTGDRVRVKGWTYYDYFHKNEEEYDPEHPLLGAGRKTVWEVHPALDIEVLPKEGK